MRNIQSWKMNEPWKNWTSIYSYMLFPSGEQAKIRDSFFTYYFAYYLTKVNKLTNDALSEFDSKRIAEALVYTVNRGRFLKMLHKEDRATQVAGFVMRYMYSMHELGLEPSLSRAVYAFLRYFAEQHRLTKKKPFNLNRAEVIRCYKSRYDVLHFAAAYTIIKPINFNYSAIMSGRVGLFIELSRHYLERAITMNIGSDQGGPQKRLINPDSAFCINVPNIPAIPDNILHTYPICFSHDEVAPYLEGYSEKTRGKKY